MTDLTAGSRDAVVLREALRAALSWWEAGQILHGDEMFEREAEEFDWCRSLLGLPPLNKATDQHFGEHDIKACGHPSHGACCTRCGEWRVPEHDGTCNARKGVQE